MTTSLTPDSLIQEFIALLVSRNLDAAAAMVTDDFEYDNVPMGKTFGPQGLRDTLNGFFSMCTGIDWKILRSYQEIQRTNYLLKRERRLQGYRSHNKEYMFTY